MRLGSLGPVELILIVMVIVLIFGASKLGDIGGAMGKSIKEFKKASKDEDAPVTTRTDQTVVTTGQEPATPVTPPAAVRSEYRPPDVRPG